MNTSSTASPVSHVSVLDRLVAAGADISALAQVEGNLRQAVPAVRTFEDGTRVAGLVYQIDHRCEEEVGIGELVTALTGQDPKHVQLTGAGLAHVARFADVNGLVLSVRALPARTYAWGDDLDSASGRTDYAGRPRPAGWAPAYASYWDDTMAGLLGVNQLRWATVAELRAKATELGLRRLPRRRADLLAAIVASPELAAARGPLLEWPGWFHTGRQLVVRADSGPVATIVEALGDAIDECALGATLWSGAFFSGLFLFDARDESDQVRADRAERVDWHDAQMKALEPVAAELASFGHGWYFLGDPRQVQRAEGQTVEYFINGYPGLVSRDGVRCVRQPRGWYTLAELRAEQFIRDSAARVDARAGKAS